MPAQQRHPSPHQQLTQLCRRARAAGVPFAKMWDRALPPPYLVCTRDRYPVKPGGVCTKPSCDRRASLEDPWEQEHAEDADGLLMPSGRLYPVDQADRAPEGAILWPRDTWDRRVAYDALASTREGWRRAYEGEPAPRRESALRALGSSLDAAERASRPGAAVQS